MSVYQKVKGWIGELFSVGIDGPQIVWDSANDAASGIGNRIKFLLGDKTDATTELAADMARVAGADPTEAQDYVTKTYGDTTYAPASAAVSGATRTIELPLINTSVGTTVSSTMSLPSGAKILRVAVRVDTAYSNADNKVTVGTTTDGAAAFAALSDSKLNKLGTYDLPQYTDHGGAGAEKVDCVVSGTAAAAGVAFIIVEYSVPDA